MSEQRPLRELDATVRRQPVWVIVPPEHQGVGNALRAAYPAERAGLPGDIALLLARLSSRA